VKSLHEKKVFLAKDEHGNKVVLKKAEKNEAELHAGLSRNLKNHTIGFKGSFTIEDQTWIVLDYCNGGSVTNAMSAIGTKNHFSERQQHLQNQLAGQHRHWTGGWNKKAPNRIGVKAGNTIAVAQHRATVLTPKNLRKTKKIMLGMAEAVAKLHDKGIVHRDIKPANFVITKDDDGNTRVLLGDFGTAGKNDESFDRKKDSVPVDLPHYKDPVWMVKTQQLRKKVIEEYSIDKSVDLYSLGVSFYEMVLDELPFDSTFFYDVTNMMIEAGGAKEINDSSHIERLPAAERKKFQDLINSLMNMTPNDRIEASEIKNHPFFSELKR
jgi:serine/threonine protein kinase